MCVALGLAVGGLAQEQTLVLPPGTEDRAGDSAHRILESDSLRFQQFFSSELLSPAMPNGAWITGLSLRQDQGSRGFSGQLTFESVEVILSTADRTLTNPSRRFADNLGPDATTVSSLAPVHWSLQHIQGRANPFEIALKFAKPFRYDPRQGNLLIDLRLMSASSDAWLDLDSSLSLPRERAWYVWGRMGDPPANVTDLIGGSLVGGAYAMRLDFFPIPEPPEVALFCIGLAAVIVNRRRAALRHLSQL